MGMSRSKKSLKRLVRKPVMKAMLRDPTISSHPSTFQFPIPKPLLEISAHHRHNMAMTKVRIVFYHHHVLSTESGKSCVPDPIALRVKLMLNK